ncbi:Chitinase II [Beauveria brongniartii RCEF 3172]|uniref:chitinase n=1 Tax=Beauveria brongniartii RCEF 3172 TaxID=1081107 RepID=A0A167CRF7_9HYPO|nr:Chitinase II [Beauveria brongniartii RCEF 3172]
MSRTPSRAPSARPCGFGPEYCGDGCLGTCNAVAECGRYAATPGTKCPLNVCCSQYGFCGFTELFCDAKCQSNCGQPTSPSCPSSRTADGLKRKIAYYELFGVDRACDKMMPEAIPAGALTHINLAFIQFGQDYKVVDTGGDIVARVSKLKLKYPGLRVNMAVGGWEFNDPPTSHYFSDMAGSSDNQQVFIDSVVAYLTKYGLDGIDLDWEYPAADDRGGVKIDTKTYVLLMANLRKAFNKVNPGWEITCTIPSSYWYLRHFDLPGMSKYADYFNLMSYDIHGMWDKHNKETGPYLRGHTNLTEIDEGLKLLWRVGVEPSKVVMGMGFYGRSFRMADSNCWQPECKFSAAGNAGDCSGQAGILYYAEIASTNESINVATHYDPVSTVKVNVFNGNQWVAYDDAQSWADKLEYLTGHCLGGLMIWAIDQDTGQYDALAGLLGADATARGLTKGGSLSDAQKKKLADEFAAYTGQNCFVTPECNDGVTDYQGDPNYVCPKGWSSVSTAHSPDQRPDYYISDGCKKGSFRHICCPTQSMPKNCAWNGEPNDDYPGCTGHCGANQFELNIDRYVDAKGEKGVCYNGYRSLCCDSTEVLSQCSWTDCQTETPFKCPKGSVLKTWRYDDNRSALCPKNGAQAFCCPQDDDPQNCHWTFESLDGTVPSEKQRCLPTTCPDTQIQYTLARVPPNTGKDVASLGGFSCTSIRPLPNQKPDWPYCCDPPEDYNGKWPVDPSYLWADPDKEKGADIVWAYQDDYGNNNADTEPDSAYGDDPYGFVMLDGPPGSVDSTFPSAYTVARAVEPVQQVKRSLITTNRTLIDSAFDHSGEVFHAFCNYQDDSKRCQKIFHKGAEDTIIKLPDHVGEGPFARVVSMEEASAEYQLPGHHSRKRAAQELQSKVWRIKIDYNFHAIKKDDGPVNMRVDFTNLIEYWDDVTDTPAKARAKRELRDGESLSYRHWRHKVTAAKVTHDRMRKRQDDIMAGSTTHLQGARGDDDEDDDMAHESVKVKRWFGSFINWIKKVTTVEKSDKGFIPMAFKKSILLYRAFVGCARTNAQMNIYLDAEAAMDGTYAYYYSGALGGVVPTATYAYFGMQPHMYLGLTVTGSARLEYRSDRVKLVPTISYPGLAVKGLAAVGPTLDIYGQIVGIIQVSGTMQVGARYTFDKTEMWWPDDDEAKPVLQNLLDNPEPVKTGLVPEFKAAVAASIDVDFKVTPEAHIGIKIGGGGSFGITLVDAQVVGYVNNTLRFHADANGQTDGAGYSGSYNYGVYLLYNIGVGGWASIVGFTWNVKSRDLFDTPKTITLYSDGGVFSSGGGKKRSEPLIAGRAFHQHVDESLGLPEIEARGLLNTISAHELDAPESVFAQARIVGMDGEVLWSSGDEVVNITLPKSAPSLQRRDDGPDAGGSPDFSLGNLTCPVSQCDAKSARGLERRATQCGWVLPDFRYNCGAFPDGQIVGPAGASTGYRGICTNVDRFFTARGVTRNGLTLTWDPTGQTPRRNFACKVTNPKKQGSSYCFTDNVIAAQAVGLSSSVDLLSCDEYPCASFEEGGGYFGTLAAGATSIATLCVPIWQQTLQGNCNGLLSTLKTNVAHFDDPTAAADWQSWDGGNADWLADGGGGWQRTARYVSQIPQAGGISDGDYAPNSDGHYGGYFLRRNFTMGLAAPANANDGGAWGAQSASSWTGGAQSNNRDVTLIACAVNTFNQVDIYQEDSYNAYCFTGGTSPAAGYGNVASFQQCKVTFTGVTPGPNSKRSLTGEDEPVIGTFNGWGVKKIVMRDNDSENIPAPDFIPDPADLMPVEIVDSPDFV